MFIYVYKYRAHINKIVAFEREIESYKYINLIAQHQHNIIFFIGSYQILYVEIFRISVMKICCIFEAQTFMAYINFYFRANTWCRCCKNVHLANENIFCKNEILSNYATDCKVFYLYTHSIIFYCVGEINSLNFPLMAKCPKMLVQI